MSEKLGYPIYWIVFVCGLLSYIFNFTVEYGIIFTLFITLVCGVFNVLIAISLKNKILIILSILLIISPYIMFLFLRIF